jgi:hypothetical protein
MQNMPMKVAANLNAITLDDRCGAYLYMLVVANDFNLVF